MLLVLFFYLTFQNEHRDLRSDELVTSSPAFILQSYSSRWRLNDLEMKTSELAEAEHRPSRYMLGLNYWEQLTMATGNMFSLVCLGKWWNITIVKPFTYNSRLYGLRRFKPGNKLAHATQEGLRFMF